jgi:hypothetical protein
MFVLQMLCIFSTQCNMSQNMAPLCMYCKIVVTMLDYALMYYGMDAFDTEHIDLNKDLVFSSRQYLV